MADNQRRIQRSWCLYDWANSAFATVVLAAVLPVYFVSQVPAEGVVLPILFNRPVSAASLWGYAVALSMLILAFAAPLLGSLADRHGWHKRLMLFFWLCGCLATASLALSGPGDYLALAAIFITANLAFAGANIFYNAYLPFLVPVEQSDRLSARGFAFGYIGGGLLLAIVFLVILNAQALGFSDRGAATRFGFLLTAAWWFIFSLPTFLYLPKTEKRSVQKVHFGLRGWLEKFRDLLRYPDLCIFLLAFLCYNDGIQTIISVSAVYAKDELHLPQTTVIGCFLMIQFLAMPGSLLFARISEKTGTVRAIPISLGAFLLVCIFAYRLETAMGFWIIGAVIAI
ncbi:MAG: MFS transporter, partial [Desulfuromonas sp.]